MIVNDVLDKLLNLQEQGKGSYTVIIPRGLVDNEVSRVDVRDEEKKINII